MKFCKWQKEDLSFSSSSMTTYFVQLTSLHSLRSFFLPLFLSTPPFFFFYPNLTFPGSISFPMFIFFVSFHFFCHPSRYWFFLLFLSSPTSVYISLFLCLFFFFFFFFFIFFVLARPPFPHEFFCFFDFGGKDMKIADKWDESHK